MESATKSGTALYEQDLATCLKDHFKELIDELNAIDAAVSDAEFDDYQSPREILLASSQGGLDTAPVRRPRVALLACSRLKGREQHVQS